MSKDLPWFYEYSAYITSSTYLLGTMASLGEFVNNASISARTSLGDWSTTLFDGEKDAAGYTIV